MLGFVHVTNLICWCFKINTKEFADLCNVIILKFEKANQVELVKPKKQICSHLMTANQGGQKNRNGKMIANLFHNVVY